MTLDTATAIAPRSQPSKSKSKSKRKPISKAEAERRRRQAAAQEAAQHHRDRVLPFLTWCMVNGFSKATGLRILNSGNGPPVLQLSARRIGIKESDNARWQASRTR